MTRLGLLVAAAVIVADQLSKAWVIHFFAAQDDPIFVVLPVFNLVLTGNRGISFGILNSGAVSALVFTAIALAVVAALIVWLRRVATAHLAVAIGLVAGGAIGNVIDRLWRGAVVDFLDFHVAEWHWFVFNLADAAICMGVGIMILDGLLSRRETVN